MNPTFEKVSALTASLPDDERDLIEGSIMDAVSEYMAQRSVEQKRRDQVTMIGVQQMLAGEFRPIEDLRGELDAHMRTLQSRYAVNEA